VSVDKLFPINLLVTFFSFTNQLIGITGLDNNIFEGWIYYKFSKKFKV